MGDNGQLLNGHEGAESAASDQLFVELQLIGRRLRRVDALLGATALEESVTPWTSIRARCAEALGAVVAAAADVPDARPEYAHEPRQLLIRDLRLDPFARRVWYADTELELATKEFGLLGALALDPMRVHSKAELLKNVWGYRATPRTRTVDSHASRLRRKLVVAGATPQEWVVNEWGVGYALLRPSSPAPNGRTARGAGP